MLKTATKSLKVVTDILSVCLVFSLPWHIKLNRLQLLHVIYMSEKNNKKLKENQKLSIPLRQRASNIAPSYGANSISIMLNRLGMDRECDGQKMDGRNDS